MFLLTDLRITMSLRFEVKTFCVSSDFVVDRQQLCDKRVVASIVRLARRYMAWYRHKCTHIRTEASLYTRTGKHVQTDAETVMFSCRT